MKQVAADGTVPCRGSTSREACLTKHAR